MTSAIALIIVQTIVIIVAISFGYFLGVTRNRNE